MVPMRCPACQSDNRPEAKFCEQRGTRLELACTACGARRSEGAKFCSACGAPVETRGPGAGADVREI
jgi:uncharacterized membrane protein YvbJ